MIIIILGKLDYAKGYSLEFALKIVYQLILMNIYFPAVKGTKTKKRRNFIRQIGNTKVYFTTEKSNKIMHTFYNRP